MAFLIGLLCYAIMANIIAIQMRFVITRFIKKEWFTCGIWFAAFVWSMSKFIQMSIM